MHSTQSCLKELTALSSETSSEKRREVLRRVTDLFFMTYDRQTLDEINIFGTVMERIAYELEVEARAELSQRICEIYKSPRDLVCRLAADDIAVARPVLEHSRVLTDEDLVRIAKAQDQDHLHAIAKRDALAPSVTDVIVARGESPAIVAVTNNHGAEFSQNCLDVLAEKSCTDAGVLTALGARKDLPPDLMVAIKRRVAQRMKSEMGGKSSSAELSELDSLIEKGTANLDLEDIRESNDELQALARKDQLTEEDVIQLAKVQRLPETVHALSVLTGLDDRMVSYCLLNKDVTALGILCKANDFKATSFLALMQTQARAESSSAREVAQAMREYDSLSVGKARRILRFLKMRNSVLEGV